MSSTVMLLSRVVEASEEVRTSSSRTAKVAAIAAALREAGLDEIETVAAFLSGGLRQRRTGLGFRGLGGLPAPAGAPSLTVIEVNELFEALSALSGVGSKGRRAALVDQLFGRATAQEQEFLARLVTGELRQGALDGLMLEAIAQAAGVPSSAVRRASMFSGDPLPVAVAALTEGEAGLSRFKLELGRPLRPMLASSAIDVAAAFAELPAGERLAVDCKVDGIRIQVHKFQGQVRVFTRSLEEISQRVPEVVEAVAALPAQALVLDGEAIALNPDGRPRPFQETGARASSHVDVDSLRAAAPLTSYFFDLLHLEGVDLVDAPAQRRFEQLSVALPSSMVVPRLFTSDPVRANEYLTQVLADGHEGVVVKSLSSSYEAGRRGGAWVKVKPRHTLDLVVLAVEWGSGRREKWLSNIHLGARDPANGGFVMLGKTFKGMTDEMLTWQTERFLGLEISREGHVVYLRPEQVVEIAFDGLQTSTRYPGGMALRFARVLRYREDKKAQEADTIEQVRRLHLG